MSLLDLGKGYWIKIVRPRKRMYMRPRAEEVKLTVRTIKNMKLFAEIRRC